MGYVRKPGLTCTLCVGTTVALRSLSGARKQASPAQTDETCTAADVGAPLVTPECPARMATPDVWSRFEGPIDISLIRSYRGTCDLYANTPWPARYTLAPWWRCPRRRSGGNGSRPVRTGE